MKVYPACRQHQKTQIGCISGGDKKGKQNKQTNRQKPVCLVLLPFPCSIISDEAYLMYPVYVPGIYIRSAPLILMPLLKHSDEESDNVCSYTTFQVVKGILRSIRARTYFILFFFPHLSYGKRCSTAVDFESSVPSAWERFELLQLCIYVCCAQ